MILSSIQRLIIFGSLPAPGIEFLAEVGHNNEALATVEIGAALIGGSPAAGRRVQLPWGDESFDFGALTSDGKTLMRRAIEWAAGQDVASSTCGDGTCEPGEECDCPADCGAPADFEQPGVSCDDGLDNDCDGVTDCDDINCPADPACKPSVCGDAVCSGGEDPCHCPEDCGPPPPFEDPGTMCVDELDNDCDGQIDCADLNCITHPACCKQTGSACVMNPECCSGFCNPGTKKCL